MQNLVIIWNNLGPYHLARLRASAAALREHQIRVVGIELASAEETRDWIVDHSVSDCEIHTLSTGLLPPQSSASLSRSLIAKLRSIDPQIIALAGYDRGEMRAALRWAKRHGAKTILMSETKWDDRPRPFWKLAMLRRVVREFDAALVSGAASGEYLVALSMRRERIFRQYGVVDNTYLSSETDEARSAGAGSSPALPKYYFLACSRLIEARKNIKFLLAAFKCFQQRTEDTQYELLICGDGPDRGMLERYVRDEKVSRVSFAGFQQLDHLVHYYAHATCFVHTAVNEAWGLVVNEAMAAGLPVLVSSRCGCAYDLVSEGVNGFAFDPYDMNALAQRMVQVHSMPDSERRQMGAASRRIVSAFGPRQFGAGIVQAVHCASR